jgi:hypothetical protein
MSKLKSYRPTAPLVINLIALFIVLGGQAIAQSGKHRVKRDDLAAGSVTARNLAPGAVTGAKLGRHSVTGAGFASEAVIGRAIHPGSVHGVALAGTLEIPATVPDADPIGDDGDGTWTISGAAATCPPGALLLNGGIQIQDGGNHRALIQSTFPSSTNASTWVGQISTDTGGASPGLLLAHCLR